MRKLGEAAQEIDALRRILETGLPNKKLTKEQIRRLRRWLVYGFFGSGFAIISYLLTHP